MTAVGIGGVFFRARDPKALREWYGVHLGITADDSFQWMQRSGPTVFMPFAHDTDYFPADRQWMLNFRVDDLDGLIGSLRAAGVEVATDTAWDTPETGRFARIHDPEGNPIELWQPPGA